MNGCVYEIGGIILIYNKYTYHTHTPPTIGRHSRGGYENTSDTPFLHAIVSMSDTESSGSEVEWEDVEPLVDGKRDSHNSTVKLSQAQRESSLDSRQSVVGWWW